MFFIGVRMIIDLSISKSRMVLNDAQKEIEYEDILSKFLFLKNNYMPFCKNGDMDNAEKLKKNALLSLMDENWEDDFFIHHVLSTIIEINAVRLIPAAGWASESIRDRIYYERELFDRMWRAGMSDFAQSNDMVFLKGFVIPQKNLYENFDIEAMRDIHLSFREFLQSLFIDRGWVYKHIDLTPEIYFHLSDEFKVDEVIFTKALSGLKLSVVLDFIPFSKIVSEPKKYIALLRSALNSQQKDCFNVIVGHMKKRDDFLKCFPLMDAELLNAFFESKFIAPVIEQDTEILANAIKVSANIFNHLSQDMRASKSVVQTMIVNHRSLSISWKDLGYWPDYVFNPSLEKDNFVYLYLSENPDKLSIDAFRAWKNNKDFILSLGNAGKNPFLMGVQYSRDDFFMMCGGDKESEMEVVSVIADFYPFASESVLKDPDAIMLYLNHGTGDFNDIFNSLSVDVFNCDDVIIELIKNDFGEVFDYIPNDKWSQVGFVVQYLNIFDNFAQTCDDEQRLKNFKEYYFSFIPEVIKEYFILNNIVSNYGGFLEFDQKKKMIF